MFGSFAAVIAINDAAWLYRCHWLVASDRHILEPVLKGEKRRPLTGAFTNGAWGPRFQAAGMAWIRPATFRKDGPLGAEHTSYSMVAAIGEALRMAGPAGRVEIFGFDASGDPSITGIDRFTSHKPHRWRDEAKKLRQIWDASRIVNHGRAPAWLLEYIAGTRTNPTP